MSKVKSNIKEIMSQLTLQEKTGLLSGFDYWHTKSIERLNVPALPMADGPHGLRKQKANELGIDKSYPATCFPTAALLACSWDEELSKKQGEAIGKEARSMGLSCVLGPGINIKRSPLCGRNFEYFSEDPLLSGRMGAGIVNGLQEQGVSACLKHFAVNNQEDYRFWVDAIVDERTLREIYLASFEYALMYCSPKAMMCSYNKINGIFASENRWLLTDVLRNDWGYEGIVMSDWGAVNNRPQGVWAGLDLEMPASFGINDAEIVKAASGGDVFLDSTDPNFNNTLTKEEIDTCVERMLEFVLSLEHTLVPVPCDFEPHHKIAREIAAESMVLLENDGILPLKKGSNVVVIGDMAKNPVYQGGGSSHIVPTKVDIPLDCIAKYSNVTYIKGNKLTADDKKKIKKADAVIVFAGMPDGSETEGADRESLLLPQNQYKLIADIAEINFEKLVLVVCSGAPVAMPTYTSAALFAYLGGQAMGGAVADLLFGVKNPCGKLAESFPCCIESTPSYLNFPGDGKTVIYGEGVHVGYRWYNKMERANINIDYEFGHGMSYTNFKYSDWTMSDKNGTVTVTNVGDYDGKEIVQLFIDGELRGFKKVFIKKGESKTITVEITPKAGQQLQKQGVEKVTMYTQTKALWDIPNGKPLLEELCELHKVKLTKELVNTRDCSVFVGNVLRNMVTMFDLGWTFEDLQKRIDKINELNGI